MAHIIIGTAGHIDHGKTALVQALTGTDTDRLKEEKERGLTIDLGFAHLGDSATIIDVPGHEKFVRNMVAGVSTIDLVLFVVAADDGVMPQTREHLDILNVLQVRHGIIVISKCDLVADDWLSLVKDEVRTLVAGTFLAEAEIVSVSALTTQGIPELKQKIDAFVARSGGKQDKGVFWMPVDRAFTMRGFGTVVTGSVLSGTLQVGQNVELLPARHLSKVRGLQSHGRTVERVKTGDRAAVNLQALEKQNVTRGDVLAEPSTFQPSNRFDARLQLLPAAGRELKHRTRVRLHVGTVEVMARVAIAGNKTIAPGATSFVQFHLERPVSARRLDPFVIRQFSPTITIGGGVILNAAAPRRKLSDPNTVAELRGLEQEEPAEVLESILLRQRGNLSTIEHLASEMALSQEQITKQVETWRTDGRVLVLKKNGRPAVVHLAAIDAIRQSCLDALAKFHAGSPMKPGLNKAELREALAEKCDVEVLERVLKQLKESGLTKESNGVLSLASHEVEISPELLEQKARLTRLLLDGGFSPPTETELPELLALDHRTVNGLLAAMVALGEVVRLDDNIYLHRQFLETAHRRLVDFLGEKEEITISQFKDLVDGASRKYAMPLINYFDKEGVTERDGDVRILAP